MDRSARRETRNPLLALEGCKALQELSQEAKDALATALKSIQADARIRAEESWRKHKGPMAAYWKACGVYAGHLSRVLRG